MTADRPLWFDNPAIRIELWPALGETLLMTVFATAFAIIVGLPLGVWLYMTAKGSLTDNRMVYRIVSTVVDIGRSIPFIILMIALIPFARFVTGSALGWQATVVSLTVSAIPFYARLVEAALREVAAGKIEAVQMMGADSWQLIRQVLVPEALPGLLSGATVTAVALVSYTAMAGAVGGGGLGALAISYGYQRYQTDTMIACIVLLVACVALLQLAGDLLARSVDHRQ
ncbi:methionine ABC transporter permease [Brevibacterium yomogidense]|uniref:Methionine ABC transporter permease protein n=1 Tax=Brevibacterium yomogidense TaxID=946573 RepID=A0A1X6XMI1_9MICO|nr:methionine ABC transporter permease [Brevibacterium yomogidense]SLM99747.1 Methionine ABC transporter permease protein [Brevibacterium yomogidense]